MPSRLPVGDVLGRFREAHAGRYDYSRMQYQRQNLPIEIQCPAHGPFFQLPKLHAKGVGCPLCALASSDSRTVKATIEWFEARGLSYVRELAMGDCRHVQPLRFDFYVPRLFAFVEVHGQQHYVETGGSRWGDKLSAIQLRDRIKREFALRMGFAYVEIRYDEDPAEVLNAKFGHLYHQT